MLDAEQVLAHAAGKVGVLALQQQVHGGDGRLDLVDPGGVIVHHVLVAQVRAVQGLGLLLAQGLHDAQVVGLCQGRGLGKVAHQRRGQARDARKEAVPALLRGDVQEDQRPAEHKEDQRRIEHRAKRQAVERKDDEENQHEQKKQADSQPVFL